MKLKQVTENEVDLRKSCNSDADHGDLVVIKKRGRYYPAIIKSGYFYDPTYHRLSNAWSVIRINKDGTLRTKEEDWFYEPMYRMKKEPVVCTIINFNV